MLDLQADASTGLTVEQRLSALEDLVKFIGSSFRVRRTVMTGLTSPDGKPLVGPTVEGTLVDLWLQRTPSGYRDART